MITLPARPAAANPAQADKSAASGRAPASATFCLFELPGSSDGTRKLINLISVQFMELSSDQLRIYYGGGNLGSGYEVRVLLKSSAEGPELIARMQKAAQECK